MRRTAAIALALAVVAGAASAQNAQRDEAARRALAAGEFARVIAVYQADLQAGNKLGDQALYRLAIAYSRTGDPARASAALEAALQQNPGGSFASSPARLQQLQATIQQACELLPARSCGKSESATLPQVGATAPATGTPQPAPVAEASPAQAASTPAEPAAAASAPVEAVAPAVVPVQDSGQKPSDPPAVEGTPQHQEDQDAAGRAWFWAAAAVALATIAVGVFAWRAQRRRKGELKMRAEWHPLVSLRDEGERVLAAMQRVEGGAEKEVTQALQAFLPLLEREIGRSHWRAGHGKDQLVTLDVQAVEVLERLSNAAVPVISARREEVQNLFQRPAL